MLLGGFSQGGSLAAYAGLTYKQPLAGLLLLSCWAPIHQCLRKVLSWLCSHYNYHYNSCKLLQEALESNKSIPILQCHGKFALYNNYNVLLLL